MSPVVAMSLIMRSDGNHIYPSGFEGAQVQLQRDATSSRQSLSLRLSNIKTRALINCYGGGGGGGLQVSSLRNLRT